MGQRSVPETLTLGGVVKLPHLLLIALTLACLLVGRSCAQETPWQLIQSELVDGRPETASIENLTAAMAMAMMNNPKEAMPIFRVAFAIACQNKQQRRAQAFVLYAAGMTRPELQGEFIIEAQEIAGRVKL